MPYPERLLPSSTDEFIEPPDVSKYLIRWTRPEFPLKDEDGKLAAIAIEEKRFFNYSVNKIPRSLSEDIFIEFTQSSPFLDSWQKGLPSLVVSDEDYNRH